MLDEVGNDVTNSQLLFFTKSNISDIVVAVTIIFVVLEVVCKWSVVHCLCMADDGAITLDVQSASKSLDRCQQPPHSTATLLLGGARSCNDII